MIKMGHHEPTTYHEGDFHPDFEHLIRHNTNVAFSPEFHRASDHSLVYGSPNFQQQTGTPNMSHSFDAQHYHAEPASGVNRYEFVHGAQFPIHAVQSLESPIPSTTEVDQMAPRIVPDARRTRRGRSAARSHSPGRTDSASTRVSKPAKAKKPSKSSAKTPQLDGPLSELTKDMSIPIRDMEEWVNRPLEVRLKEVEKRNGYVTRPMNSFMLYRSAYAERTKQFCIQNNHQVVSAVSGQSWPKEPPAIRDFYNGLASLERDNHAKAHPSYKFSPSKPVTFPASRRRKTSTSDADSDEYSSDGDADPDKDWIPHGGEHKTNRTTAMANRKQIQETFPAYSSHLHQPYQSMLVHQTQQPVQSPPMSTQIQQEEWSFATSNAANPFGMQMGWPVVHDNKAMLMAQYQQQQQQQQPQPAFVQNPYYLNQPHEFQHFHESTPMVGLPTTDFFGSLQQQQQQQPSGNMFEVEHQLDPMLLHFDHQQTPPLDDPATPENVFGEGASRLDLSNSQGKRQSIHAPTSARGLFDDGQDDMLHHSYNERQSEFDSWMNAAHAPSPTSP